MGIEPFATKEDPMNMLTTTLLSIAAACTLPSFTTAFAAGPAEKAGKPVDKVESETVGAAAKSAAKTEQTVKKTTKKSAKKSPTESD
jgi:hypothetical protein